MAEEQQGVAADGGKTTNLLVPSGQLAKHFHSMVSSSCTNIDENVPVPVGLMIEDGFSTYTKHGKTQPCDYHGVGRESRTARKEQRKVDKKTKEL